MKNFNSRKLYQEKKFAKNFYVFDIETGGLVYNEPVQITALLYEDGKEVSYTN